MKEFMIVIAAAAANFRGLFLDQGDDVVVGDALALYAIVVDVVTQPYVWHRSEIYNRKDIIAI